MHELVLVGVQVVEIPNPFEPQKQHIRNLTVTNGTIYSYIDVTGKDIFYNGVLVQQPNAIYPQAGGQLVVLPHMGKGLGSILGWVAFAALSVWAGGWVAGLHWGGTWGMIGKAIVYGAVMYLGGKVINSIFHLNQPKKDHSTDTSYGWSLPTIQTTEGSPIGETYGECMPTVQLLMSHVETTNSEDQDTNVQYLNLLLCGGWGPVDSIEDIRIGYTPIAHFTDVQIETRLGTNDQPPISFFPDTVLDQNVGMELKQNKPVVRTTETNKAQRLDVTVEFPSGLYHMGDDGNYSKCTAKYRIEYKKTAGTAWKVAGEYTLSKATNAAVRWTYTVAGNLEKGQYDVRITPTSLPSGTRDVAYMQWSLLSSFIYDGAKTRPGKVLVGVRIKATNQLSGNLPNINWRQRRLHVQVFNPDTGLYEAKSARNPIWAAYDILHNCKQIKNINTGQMEYVVEGSPAKNFTQYYDQWVEAAAYADEQISDGSSDGGTEARFEFDAFYNGTITRWEAANKAAAVGHAVIIRHGTQYGVTVDKPGNICQVFGEGQTVLSSVTGSFAAQSDRAKAVEITYNDTDNDFKNTLMKLYSPTYASDLTVQDNTAKVTLFGVKRRSQAYREGRYYMATNERQLQTIRFSTDINGIVCQYGDIIGFNHAVAQMGLASGRIVSVSGNKVTLDKPVTLKATTPYALTVVLSKNDHIISRQVVAVATDTVTDTLTVDQGYDAAELPEQYDPYAFGLLNKEVKPFRIIKTERDGDNKVSITALEYDPAVYEIDYDKYPNIDYTKPTVIEAPVNLELTEMSYNTTDGTQTHIVHAAWSMPTGQLADKFLVYYSLDGLSWTYHGTTQELAVDIVNAMPRTQYYVRVCASRDGANSAFAQKSIVTSGGGGKPPVTVTDISAAAIYRQGADGDASYDVHVKWEPANSAGQVYYQSEYINGSPVDNAGLPGKWLYAGEGLGQLVIPQALADDTYRIAVCGIKNGEVIAPEDSKQITIKIVHQSIIPLTPTGFALDIGTECRATWAAVTNTSIAFYELRTDDKAGTDSKALLVRTNDIRTTLPLTSRTGRLFLFARSVWGVYSTAATLTYNKPAPAKPKAPTLIAQLGGFGVLADSLPAGCTGMAVYVNGALALRSATNAAAYVCAAGIYDVSVAYSDMFGDGEQSVLSRITVKDKVDAALLEDEAINLAKMDKTVQQAVKDAQSVTAQVAAIKQTQDSIISTVAANKTAQEDADAVLTSQIKQTATGLTTVVSNLSKAPNQTGYAAFAQLYDNIQLKVDKAGVISAINLTPETIRISGKLLTIDTDTTIANNVIVNRMLAANSITADKMQVESLSAVCATIGTLRTKSAGARVELKDNLIEVYDENNRVRVRMGVF